MQGKMKGRCDMLREARRHLGLALELLDCAHAPAQIGAHVDLAAHQVDSELSDPSGASVAYRTGQYDQAVH